MQQPVSPNAPPAKEDSANNRRPRAPPPPPKPEELLSHYESQGMDSREASLKAIGDLQAVLYRTVAAAGRGRGKEKAMADVARKLDNANARLAILEMKIDSKPGYAETLGIVVAAGAVVKGFTAALPHVVGAVGNIWNAVSSAAKGGGSNPSSS